VTGEESAEDFERSGLAKFSIDEDMDDDGDDIDIEVELDDFDEEEDSKEEDANFSDKTSKSANDGENWDAFSKSPPKAVSQPPRKGSTESWDAFAASPAPVKPSNGSGDPAWDVFAAAPAPVKVPTPPPAPAPVAADPWGDFGSKPPSQPGVQPAVQSSAIGGSSSWDAFDGSPVGGGGSGSDEWEDLMERSSPRSPVAQGTAKAESGMPEPRASSGSLSSAKSVDDILDDLEDTFENF